MSFPQFHSTEFKIFNRTLYYTLIHILYHIMLLYVIAKPNYYSMTAWTLNGRNFSFLVIMFIHIRLLAMFTAGSSALFTGRCAFKSMLFAFAFHCCAACLACAFDHFQNVLVGGGGEDAGKLVSHILSSIPIVQDLSFLSYTIVPGSTMYTLML